MGPLILGLPWSGTITSGDTQGENVRRDNLSGGTKHPAGQKNMQMDKASGRQNVCGDKIFGDRTSVGQNIRGDKTSGDIKSVWDIFSMPILGNIY